jgi:hypothetical protein
MICRAPGHGLEDRMLCPNCGAEQPESFECVRCGIIFAKFTGHRQREARAAAEGAGWRRPLGRVARLARALAGVALVALSVLMYLNGAALKSFGPYVALVSFAATGLYFLVSSKDAVGIGRFFLEAVATAAIGLAVYWSLPDAFLLDRPMYVSTARPPSREVRLFLDEAEARVAGITAFLDLASVPGDEADALVETLRPEKLVRAFAVVPEADREMVRPAMARLQAIQPLLDTLVRRFPEELPVGPARWVPMAVIVDLKTHLAQVAGQVQAARSHIETLDAAIASGADLGAEAVPK